MSIYLATAFSIITCVCIKKRPLPISGDTITNDC